MRYTTAQVRRMTQEAKAISRRMNLAYGGYDPISEGTSVRLPATTPSKEAAIPALDSEAVSLTKAWNRFGRFLGRES